MSVSQIRIYSRGGKGSEPLGSPMAKDKKKKKSKSVKKDKKDKKDKKPIATNGPGAAPASVAVGYTDGAPLDRVQYLEAKLILKPERFDSVQSFRDFGKLVQRTAKKVGIGFIETERQG